MKVLKFGGTSVGSPERIKNVAALITERGKNIIVLSAMSGTTNSLLSISYAHKSGFQDVATKLIDELTGKYADVIDNLYSSEEARRQAYSIIGGFFNEMRSIVAQQYSDNAEKKIVAFGELISTNLMHILLHEQCINSVLLPALDFMRTDAHNEPNPDFIKTRLNEILASKPDADLYITQGFICRNSRGEIDNLLRGGSDYTASLIGSAILAEEVQIWTDIDGMHNNDLAYFGAKILHPTCIQPAKVGNIPVRLLNTMQPEAEGTLINNVLRHGLIKAVAAKDDITAIKIKSDRMLLAYGFLKKVFDIFNKYETSIDMIVTSEVGVSLTIDNTRHIDKILNELNTLGSVTVDSDMVIICVVGDLEWQNRGFEAKALFALREIQVRMISYGGSNYNISFLIRKEDKQRALSLLSEHLF